MAAAGGHWAKVMQGGSGKLVFVPRGKTAAEAITGRKPAGGGFPGDVSDTQTIKGLGGSTGATLVQDKNGNLYVKKKGANTTDGHLLEESAADKAYRALGVDVPEHQIYQTPSGAVKLARFVEGKSLADADPAAQAKAEAILRKNFAADAVLGNWDVIGLGRDNVLIGSNGKVYRIDNGGALRYRAMGGKKAEFSEIPNEVFSMRTSSQGKPVFGSLSIKDIASQAAALVSKRSALLGALPSSLHKTMNGRINRMAQLNKIYKTLSAKGYSDNSIDGFIKEIWKQIPKGGFDPKTSAEIIASYGIYSGG